MVILKKALCATDLGMELGAPIHVFNGSHEEAAATAARVPTDMLDRYREAINFLCGYVRDQRYPEPEAPRSSSPPIRSTRNTLAENGYRHECLVS